VPSAPFAASGAIPLLEGQTVLSKNDTQRIRRKKYSTLSSASPCFSFLLLFSFLSSLPSLSHFSSIPSFFSSFLAASRSVSFPFSFLPCPCFPGTSSCRAFSVCLIRTGKGSIRLPQWHSSSCRTTVRRLIGRLAFSYGPSSTRRLSMSWVIPRASSSSSAARPPSRPSSRRVSCSSPTISLSSEVAS